MNIYNLYPIRAVVNFFQETALRSVTDRNREILMIVTISFGFLAAALYCTMKRHCFKKNLSGQQNPDEVNSNKKENTDEIPIHLVENSPLDQKPASPKNNLLQQAKDIELITDIELKSIDVIIKEKDSNLPEQDKNDLLKLKDNKVEFKNSLEVIEICLKINKCELELNEKNKNISKIKEKIDNKEKEIEQLNQEIESFSEGVTKLVEKEVSFSPDETITISSGPDKDKQVKVSEYIGKLIHEVQISKSYIVVSQEEAANRIPQMNEYLVVITGTQFREINHYPCGSKVTYTFETDWQGDGVIPEIKVNVLISSASFNEAAIINNEANINVINKEISELKKDLATQTMYEQWDEAALKRLKASLDEKKSELERMQNPK